MYNDVIEDECRDKQQIFSQQISPSAEENYVHRNLDTNRKSLQMGLEVVKERGGGLRVVLGGVAWRAFISLVMAWNFSN